MLYVSNPSMFRMCPRKAHVDPSSVTEYERLLA